MNLLEKAGPYQGNKVQISIIECILDYLSIFMNLLYSI